MKESIEGKLQKEIPEGSGIKDIGIEDGSASCHLSNRV